MNATTVIIAKVSFRIVVSVVALGQGWIGHVSVTVRDENVICRHDSSRETELNFSRTYLKASPSLPGVYTFSPRSHVSVMLAPS